MKPTLNVSASWTVLLEFFDFEVEASGSLRHKQRLEALPANGVLTATRSMYGVAIFRVSVNDILGSGISIFSCWFSTPQTVDGPTLKVSMMSKHLLAMSETHTHRQSWVDSRNWSTYLKHCHDHDDLEPLIHAEHVHATAPIHPGCLLAWWGQGWNWGARGGPLLTPSQRTALSGYTYAHHCRWS